MKVYNLTKHSMTQDQLEDGGINVPAAQEAHDLHNFTKLPKEGEMNKRAIALMDHALKAGAVPGDGVMLAGAMYFIPALVDVARGYGFIPTFSFTQRVSLETPQPDGSVKLEYIFRHEGWMHP